MIMDVARQFAAAGGGVIAILHDLNLAAMYADQIVAIRDGYVAGAGTPAEVLTDGLIAHVFDCPMRVGAVPTGNIPFVLPQSAQRFATPVKASKVA
jgi:iron complex transport system ATP-binding protein